LPHIHAQAKIAGMTTDPLFLDNSAGEQIQVEFPDDGMTATLAVTQVGDRQFRLESVPMMIDSASFRDVIEADRLDETTLRFVKVVEPSGWKVFEFYLLKERLESQEMRELLQRVKSTGGHWEQFLGGCLCICLPPGDRWDPTEAVEGTGE